MQENEERIENLKNSTGAPDERQPEQEGKLFTQEEVNNIIGQKLEKLKRQAAAECQLELDTRKAELDAREAAIECREYVLNMGYPKEYLDAIDISNVQEFKQKADLLAGISDFNRSVAPLASYFENTGLGNPANYVTSKQKHTPRKYGYQGNE